MPLSSVTVSAGVTFSLYKANTGFGNTLTQPQKKSIAPLIDTTVFTQVYAAELTIAASAFQEIDFSSFTNFVGESVAATKVTGLIMLPSGTNAICKIEPGVSNGLTWFFTGTNPGISVPTGGCQFFFQPLAQVIDSTHKTLRFTNTGSGSMTLDLIVIVGP